MHQWAACKLSMYVWSIPCASLGLRTLSGPCKCPNRDRTVLYRKTRVDWLRRVKMIIGEYIVICCSNQVVSLVKQVVLTCRHTRYQYFWAAQRDLYQFSQKREFYFIAQCSTQFGSLSVWARLYFVLGVVRCCVVLEMNICEKIPMGQAGEKSPKGQPRHTRWNASHVGMFPRPTDELLWWAW